MEMSSWDNRQLVEPVMYIASCMVEKEVLQRALLQSYRRETNKGRSDGGMRAYRLRSTWELLVWIGVDAILISQSDLPADLLLGLSALPPSRRVLSWR